MIIEFLFGIMVALVPIFGIIGYVFGRKTVFKSDQSPELAKEAVEHEQEKQKQTERVLSQSLGDLVALANDRLRARRERSRDAAGGVGSSSDEK